MSPRGPELPTLSELSRALVRQHGRIEAPPPRNAFEWVLWDNVAYLADDTKRARAFALLKRSVGLSPNAILDSSDAALLAVTKHGIVPKLFAQKLRRSAELARDEFDGAVDAGLVEDPVRAAQQLRVFPGVGEPGAEKILVATGRARTLPLESNGLRVMVRLGFGHSLKSYGATYRSVKESVPIGRATSKTLFSLYLLLQKHGRTVCRISAPRCEACALRTVCAYANTLHPHGVA